MVELLWCKLCGLASLTTVDIIVFRAKRRQVALDIRRRYHSFLLVLLNFLFYAQRVDDFFAVTHIFDLGNLLCLFRILDSFDHGLLLGS